MAIIKNKEIIQSYILTTAKYDFNVYEKRILYRMVELAQAELEGKRLIGKIGTIDYDNGYYDVSLQISSILVNEEDKNHARVKKALKSLQTKLIEYDDPDNHVWQSFSIIVNPTIKYRSNTAHFSVVVFIWEAILDFSKGFRKYELKTAMSFQSVYSMRFYELFSNQNKPITYTIEYLKEIFQIKNKYTRVNDFIKYVIIPAQKELNEHSPYSFKYTINKKGRSFHSISFTPIEIPKNRDEELEKRKLMKKQSISWEINKEFMNYLMLVFDFTKEEIQRNLDLFGKAQRMISDPVVFISERKSNAFRDHINNPKGYIINALKTELGIS